MIITVSTSTGNYDGNIVEDPISGKLGATAASRSKQMQVRRVETFQKKGDPSKIAPSF